MKRFLIHLTFISALLIVSQTMMAQPPDPPGDPSSGGGPIGGSAPIGSGIGVLLTLGAAYGAKKIHTAWKANQESLED
ncbi:MAG: hypothetical protein KKD74_08290 [Bacteroidetes bacterium]|nr:hypothetical protein [Bacteroidales bacterium]MBU1010117.1 hypothetical protein [Bacteroidota bacterium]